MIYPGKRSGNELSAGLDFAGLESKSPTSSLLTKDERERGVVGQIGLVDHLVSSNPIPKYSSSISRLDISSATISAARTCWKR
jgi:hypothetical protein